MPRDSSGPLGALFLIGLFLLTSAYVRYFRQWRGSRALLQINPEDINPDTFQDAIGQSRPGNPFFRIGSRLLEEVPPRRHGHNHD